MHGGVNRQNLQCFWIRHLFVNPIFLDLLLKRVLHVCVSVCFGPQNWICTNFLESFWVNFRDQCKQFVLVGPGICSQLVCQIFEKKRHNLWGFGSVRQWGLCFVFLAQCQIIFQCWENLPQFRQRCLKISLGFLDGIHHNFVNLGVASLN